jgi:hypothetical protein
MEAPRCLTTVGAALFLHPGRVGGPEPVLRRGRLDSGHRQSSVNVIDRVA